MVWSGGEGLSAARADKKEISGFINFLLLYRFIHRTQNNAETSIILSSRIIGNATGEPTRQSYFIHGSKSASFMNEK